MKKFTQFGLFILVSVVLAGCGNGFSCTSVQRLHFHIYTVTAPEAARHEIEYATLNGRGVIVNDTQRITVAKAEAKKARPYEGEDVTVTIAPTPSGKCEITDVSLFTPVR